MGVWRLLLPILLVASCFDGTLPRSTPLRCASALDCGDGSVCFEARCVDVLSPCLVSDTSDVQALPDGNGCGDGGICLGGACVSPRCGDGVVSGIESCDGSPDCRADCSRCGDAVVDDGEACDDGGDNSDTQPGRCRRDCEAPRCGDGVKDPGEGCDDGVANSDGLADACRGDCRLPRCGDGVLDEGEGCDDSAANGAGRDACRSICAPASCGDGILDSDEACDDGAANSDVRPDACRRDCQPARCGDGALDLGEACDDGSLNDDGRADACRTDCQRPDCGDGVIDAGEACDDGDTRSDVLPGACRSDCQPARCGDGVVDGGEVCDDGAANADVLPDRCRLDCQPARCGDGTTDLDEGCDDGVANSDVGVDACRTDCASAGCGDGVIDARELCDDGPDNSDTLADACRTRCLPARCGDGVVDGGEDCDDGGANSDLRAGACRSDCRSARCGDGVTDPGEGCDDGERNDDLLIDACRIDCAPASCGDGVVDTGEACDDGNTAGADGCSADCRKQERCGDRVVDDGEDCDDGNNNRGDGCDDCQTQGFVTTVLVSGDLEPGSASERGLSAPIGVDLDADGRVYVSQATAGLVTRIDLDGSMSTIAGTGLRLTASEGQPATTASLAFPLGLAVDPRGDVIIVDQGVRVWRVDARGTLRVVAGTGAFVSGNDGVARFSGTPANDVAVDGLGRVLVVGNDDRLRRVDFDGVIRTLVGAINVGGFNGDGVGTAVQLNNPFGIDVDDAGRVFIADTGNHVVRVFETDGRVRTIAGQGGVAGFAGDDGLATDALLRRPGGVVVDGEGGVLISDTENHRVRYIDASGVIRTVLGTGSNRFNGEGPDALATAVVFPSGLAIDGAGRLLVADQGTNRLRRLNAGGFVETIAGDGTGAFERDGRLATETRITGVSGATRDQQGRIVMVDQKKGRVHRIEVDGTLTRLAGADGGGLDRGFGGDDGPARDAVFSRLRSVVVLGDGDIVVADSDNNRLRRIDAITGVVVTIAGTGVATFNGDGPALSTALRKPDGLLVRGDGGIIFGDGDNQRVRELLPDGTIVTLLGTGVAGFNGDGLAPLDTNVRLPRSPVIDPQGRLVFGDLLNHRVRRVDDDGLVRTIAGNGSATTSGDGGLATAAGVPQPGALAFADDGTLLIASFPGNAIRRVRADGIIETIAGDGGPLPSGSTDLAQPLGDGGPAMGARLAGPSDLFVDGVGLVFVDNLANAVRRIDAEGTLSTIAGLIHPPATGPAARAALPGARALALVDGVGFVAGGALARVFSLDLIDGIAGVGRVAGYSALLNPVAGSRADLHPFTDISGIAFDGERLFVADAGAGTIFEVVRVDPLVPSSWTLTPLPLSSLRAPFGLQLDGTSLLVADRDAHCIRRVDLDTFAQETVAGFCDVGGFLDGTIDESLLFGPTHVLAVAGGIYVADTGNHRVRLVRGGVVETVIGTGVASSLGVGAPARGLPVDSPGGLAIDDDGNLFIAAGDTIRQVANVDGDPLADGDDIVRTVLTGAAVGAGCLVAIARNDEGGFVTVDACRGRAFSLTSERR